MSPTRSSSRASCSGGLAEDLERTWLVDHGPPCEQRHQQARRAAPRRPPAAAPARPASSRLRTRASLRAPPRRRAARGRARTSPAGTGCGCRSRRACTVRAIIPRRFPGLRGVSTCRDCNRGGRRWALATACRRDTRRVPCASSASTPAPRRPASASSTGRTARPATWRAAPSGPAVRISAAAATDLRRACRPVREYAPAEVAIERVFMHRNADSALKLGQARGAAICAAYSRRPGCSSTRRARSSWPWSGQGGAEKEQVQLMVKALLKLQGDSVRMPPTRSAIALCHAYSREIARGRRRRLGCAGRGRDRLPARPAGGQAPAAAAASTSAASATKSRRRCPRSTGCRPSGADVQLHTHLVVREDAHVLFGFGTERERRLFRDLLKVSGVGPSIALGSSPASASTTSTLRRAQDAAR